MKQEIMMVVITGGDEYTLVEWVEKSVFWADSPEEVSDAIIGLIGDGFLTHRCPHCNEVYSDRLYLGKNWDTLGITVQLIEQYQYARNALLTKLWVLDEADLKRRSHE